jgi:hypothetical protein
MAILDRSTASGVVKITSQAIIRLARALAECTDTVSQLDCRFRNVLYNILSRPSLNKCIGLGTKLLLISFFSCYPLVLYTMNDVTKAAENYTMSTELDDQFIYKWQVYIVLRILRTIVTSEEHLRRNPFIKRSHPPVIQPARFPQGILNPSIDHYDC